MSPFIHSTIFRTSVTFLHLAKRNCLHTLLRYKLSNVSMTFFCEIILVMSLVENNAGDSPSATQSPCKQVHCQTGAFFLLKWRNKMKPTWYLLFYVFVISSSKLQTRSLYTSSRVLLLCSAKDEGATKKVNPGSLLLCWKS